jgi:DNA-binding MarR family transcriptional regulator
MNREELFSRIYENMNAAKRVMHGRMHAFTGDFPISRSQMELLFTLKHLPKGQASPKQLATQMHLTPGAISQLTESLVAQDLILREANPDDRRTQVLKLSATGLAAIQEIKNRRHDIMKHVMQSLTTEELQVLLKVQEKLTEQLTQIDKTTK